MSAPVQVQLATDTWRQLRTLANGQDLSAYVVALLEAAVAREVALRRQETKRARR
jgi:hypothetical protein